MTFDAHSNFAYSLVAIPPGQSGTALGVTSGDGGNFPPPPFNMTIWPSGLLALVSNAEIVRVTARSGDLLTIVRAQEGSSAQNITVGHQVSCGPTAKTFTDMETAVVAGSGLTNLDGGLAASTFTSPQGIDGGSA